MLVSELQPENALSPMLVTPSLPILVTLSGIFMLVSESQS